MSSGLIALLDDIAAIAKVAASSLDQTVAQATKAGAKAAGIVIDDAAVTPRYVVGFAAQRELPIIWKIARGSLRNKLLILLPAALLLSQFAPWLIPPLLLVGGAYLCFEGFEKIWHAIGPSHHEAFTADTAEATVSTIEMENQMVSGAVRTDFILSAEIMAMTLAGVAGLSFWTQATVLGVVGIGVTALVYGVVALIVKADDAGIAMASGDRPVSWLGALLTWRDLDRTAPPRAADRALAPLTRLLGRGLVLGMPKFLQVLSLIGTAAMLWVGGGIVLHTLAGYGLSRPEHALLATAKSVGSASPVMPGLTEWLVTAIGSGLFGLILGAACLPVANHVLIPLSKRFSRPDTASRPEQAQ